MYVNVSLDDEMPIEIFAKLPLEAGINGDGCFNPTLWQERTSQWDLICRLISMLMRYNIPLEGILEQLDKSSYSMVDASGILSRILKRYLPKIEYDSEDTTQKGTRCKSCGEMTYFYEGGCGKCVSCGYSSCG
jgi:ribonucleoside-diphosphate reductase alpha chain